MSDFTVDVDYLLSLRNKSLAATESSEDAVRLSARLADRLCSFYESLVSSAEFILSSRPPENVVKELQSFVSAFSDGVLVSDDFHDHEHGDLFGLLVHGAASINDTDLQEQLNELFTDEVTCNVSSQEFTKQLVFTAELRMEAERVSTEFLELAGALLESSRPEELSAFVNEFASEIVWFDEIEDLDLSYPIDLASFSHRRGVRRVLFG